MTGKGGGEEVDGWGRGRRVLFRVLTNSRIARCTFDSCFGGPSSPKPLTREMIARRKGVGTGMEVARWGREPPCLTNRTDECIYMFFNNYMIYWLG